MGESERKAASRRATLTTSHAVISVVSVSSPVTIFRAKQIITMDAGNPTADAVAVTDGRILHVGTFDELTHDLASLTTTVDDQFGDSIVTPGFIEGHCHIGQEGSLSRFPWLGSYDRRTPDGGVQRGCPTHDAAIDRIAKAVRDSGDRSSVVALMGWDPGMANSPGLTREVLDAISPDRPLFVAQSNLHVGHANTAMLERAGITRESTEHGIGRDASGEPNGTISEMALTLILGRHVKIETGGDDAIHDGGRLARQVGCTTVTDLALAATTRRVEAARTVVDAHDFPVRVIYAPSILTLQQMMPNQVLDHVLALRATDSDKYRMGPVKFILDGSIQGRTARLEWPGYCCGDPNGMWLAEPEEMYQLMLPFHQAGLQIAMHTNGDEATLRGLEIIEKLLLAHPRFDHRHRLEHVQMATEANFKKMKALGVCVNLFANHVYYWGDIHRTQTMGPAKARRLDACGTAQRLGVPYSIHSDAPVTPLDPLFTMWCAVNRITSSGHALGDSERISAEDALRALTIDSAYLLHLDGEMGSIEVGKKADFAVPKDNPLTVDPMGIKDITVQATVCGGVVHAN